mmetsp:Transcript_42637/g.112236  ORF Transcript_42637/g.112236 Transcript_42637/m.112236 type:complete len:212 (-) Transcript_42637:564-1199(-)
MHLRELVVICIVGNHAARAEIPRADECASALSRTHWRAPIGLLADARRRRDDKRCGCANWLQSGGHDGIKDDWPIAVHVVHGRKPTALEASAVRLEAVPGVCDVAESGAAFRPNVFACLIAVPQPLAARVAKDTGTSKSTHFKGFLVDETHHGRLGPAAGQVAHRQHLVGKEVVLFEAWHLIGVFHDHNVRERSGVGIETVLRGAQANTIG